MLLSTNRPRRGPADSASERPSFPNTQSHQAACRPTGARTQAYDYSLLAMFDRDRLLRAFESQPRHQQKGTAAASSARVQQGTRDPAYSRVTIRSDLPPKLKRERGRLAAEAYRLRHEEKVSTRIRLVGSKIVLQTRTYSTGGSQNSAWATWSG